MKYDLEKTQKQILKRIAQKDRKISSKVIRKELDLSAATFSYNLIELKKKKLIDMIPSETDSRSNQILITAAGKFILSVLK